MTQSQNRNEYVITSSTEEWVLREEAPNHAEGRRYDLSERTAKMAESIIHFAKKIPNEPVNRPLISQIVRSATSVGANYCEADDAFTKKEFRHRVGICRKEAKETKYWLRMIVTACPSLREEARALWQEAKELHLIFCAILRK